MEPAIRHIPATFQQIASKMAGVEVATYKVVSLFSGCGGMDLGFAGGFSFAGRYYDKLPFEIIWANDANKAACETYKLNMKHEIHHGDIMDLLETLPDEADVVIGGFPCQDVSVNGKGQAESGERTILYKAMIEVIRRLKPKAFIAENVKGLMAHTEFFQQICHDFEAIGGYSLAWRLYNSADYEVPQRRQRLFFIGLESSEKFTHPGPETTFYKTAADILHDLETMTEDGETNHIWSKAAASPEQGSRRLKADEPATTIRAEHHGNAQWHYKLERRISLREAARLQSFPDEFRFMGGMRETERQIGNAVPPVLGWHLAKAVREHLDP